MLIILSQKIDTSSEYSDKVFTTYHYPARYKNQIHEGDTFVYYQGNRFVKEQRYYFGSGIVGKISTPDGENYYAGLISGQKFKSKVPIYLPDGKYVEQLGYNTIRKSPVPPWQSSVRPLSQQAFDYIISAAGIQSKPDNRVSIDELKECLKSRIRAFFLDNDVNAVPEIKRIASEIINLLNLIEKTPCHNAPSENRKEPFSTTSPSEKTPLMKNKLFRENNEAGKAGFKSVSEMKNALRIWEKFEQSGKSKEELYDFLTRKETAEEINTKIYYKQKEYGSE